VVVDLAGWSSLRLEQSLLSGASERSPGDFVDWLLANLKERYGIPEPIGRLWLREDRLTLLLDGLDEVRDRAKCVKELNNLQIEWGTTRLAVCSREADYNRLAGRLSLQGAVAIRPLTRNQVSAYFTATSPHLANVAAALDHDEELWDLLTTPLMLNIMVLAQGIATGSRLAKEAT
jgi:hypothetical protein